MSEYACQEYYESGMSARNNMSARRTGTFANPSKRKTPPEDARCFVLVRFGLVSRDARSLVYILSRICTVPLGCCHVRTALAFRSLSKSTGSSCAGSAAAASLVASVVLIIEAATAAAATASSRRKENPLIPRVEINFLETKSF